jgi:hypothetical protein
MQQLQMLELCSTIRGCCDQQYLGQCISPEEMLYQTWHWGADPAAMSSSQLSSPRSCYEAQAVLLHLGHVQQHSHSFITSSSAPQCVLQPNAIYFALTTFAPTVACATCSICSTATTPTHPVDSSSSSSSASAIAAPLLLLYSSQMLASTWQHLVQHHLYLKHSQYAALLEPSIEI